jgi:hypothetical protein
MILFVNKFGITSQLADGAALSNFKKSSTHQIYTFFFNRSTFCRTIVQAIVSIWLFLFRTISI